MDIICFGNATKDIFVHIKPKISGKKIFFSLGEKTEISQLEHFSGGGATNASVGFSRLGKKTGIVTVVGNDLEAKEIISELKKEKVNTFGIFKDKKTSTSCSVILTGFGMDRVVLSYSKAINALAKHHIPWNQLKPKWFYISSLHANPALIEKIVSFAARHKIKVALNAGAKEIAGGIKSLEPIFKKIDILILNAEEAQALCGHKKIKQNLAELSAHSKIAVITDGANGSFAQSGEKIFSQKAFPVKVVDATGAGDAFACAFVASIIDGKPIEFALKAGTANASSVIQFLGTKNILLNKRQIEKEIKKFGKK